MPGRLAISRAEVRSRLAPGIWRTHVTEVTMMDNENLIEVKGGQVVDRPESSQAKHLRRLAKHREMAKLYTVIVQTETFDPDDIFAFTARSDG